ncbi:MAG: TrkA family potassium uptake protein [Actinomycetia bacterium]|nr:TrkA family potassium uptake protein [Actinomycetes bacterium]
MAVIGLGRFGSAVAQILVEQGREVLAVETDPRLVQAWAPALTHVVEADATSLEALRQLGIGEFQQAVVAIGTGVEASVLCVAALADLGVPDIWAKALTKEHARILQRMGATHVVFPEREMGVRVGHQVADGVLEYLEFDDGLAMVKATPPVEAVGRTLGQAALRSKYGITVVAIKRTGEDFTYTTAETVVHADDVLVAAGRKDRIARFMVLP